MEKSLKNALGIVSIVVLAVAAYVALLFATTYARVAEPTSFRSFSVQGEGTVVSVPDIAQFTFSVITEGGTGIAKLQQDNSAKVQEAITFLKEQGIDEKDITTQQYQINPRYSYYDCSRAGGICPPPEITGYTIDQGVGVKIRDFTKIGILLSGVVEKGANSVSQLSFTIDDPTTVEGEARGKAITQAQDKAEAIAGAAGFTLGKLLSIDESQSGVQTPLYLDRAMGMGGGAIAPSVEPGSQEVLANVTLRYEIR
ncbi:MAG: hypothetical protein COT39_03790 [Parcubacteria group bacterium CG08_land_8_20_14_0_20_48_21]|nr:MAG: hypothetical protein AUK21_02405 [Parcubacteria group bacterium CG2_30_48_51]PIS32583.1 MAG: hypothetical protein COT39_03790 [Parcubacteria group bacterium CG08_land_8_20_14_0_20_48_21]PIW78823.1 MAG: hypothetical protein COZ99_04265 [Parcubacteria group bacterium CG_4_8_14_3_um_filter_48_16]PIY77996.1 MAG: hypothetical protein COY83_02145 [Parcubacteria group bacterium CG_4_10_14_0_8_um_filter_48_154]PIZ77113.1 MAG: hypothetical protein COY03_03875 [bacterium CG_4_10_14_0_2_um_filter_